MLYFVPIDAVDTIVVLMLQTIVTTATIASFSFSTACSDFSEGLVRSQSRRICRRTKIINNFLKKDLASFQNLPSLSGVKLFRITSFLLPVSVFLLAHLEYQIC